MSRIAIDPICKMEVDMDNPAAKGDYKGDTYYFCMQGCMDRFMADPERFLNPQGQKKEASGWKKLFKR